jgi:riboflavin kinase/FMN adenylyltransferase
MRIVRDFQSCPEACKGAVVALGNFDGVHLGHQEILGQCIASAKAYGVPAAVMTFEPHPREFFSGRREKLRLCSFRQKMAMMEELGIDILFLVRFNQQFSSLTADRFVEGVLHRQLAAKHVVTGYNFAFGKGRGGGTDFLETQAHRLGFGFTACPAVKNASGEAISSSAIRQLLAGGKVGEAAALMGRPYAVEGHVRRGQQRGRTIGFPTANLPLERLFKPRFGVYAVRVGVSDAVYNGVANIGIKPTVGGTAPLLEAHIFDRDIDLYGQRIAVECVDFIRDEKKFDSLEALKSQITMDCRRAKELLPRQRDVEGINAGT